MESPQIWFGDQAVEPDGPVVKSGQHRDDVEMQRETVGAVRHLEDVLPWSREVGARTPVAEHVAQCPQLTGEIAGGVGCAASPDLGNRSERLGALARDQVAATDTGDE